MKTEIFFTLLLLALIGVTQQAFLRNTGFTYLGSFESSRSNDQIEFFLSGDKVDWEDAHQMCRDELEGNLLAIDSREKQQRVLKLLEGTRIDYVWTSGRFDADAKIWYWDASPPAIFTYVNWKPGTNPRTGAAYRVALYKNLKPNWQTLPLSNQNRFVCEVISPGKNTL